MNIDMKVGDTVRIVRDEYPQLVGLVGHIEKFSDDGTIAWVVRQGRHGVWCSVVNLERLDRKVPRWHENYRVEANESYIEFVHLPSDTVLLRTMSVSMETLNGLMNEFDTYGKIKYEGRDLGEHQVVGETNKES